MRRTLLWLLAVPFVGCTCYARPVVRNLDVIGAPAVQPGSRTRGPTTRSVANLTATQGKVAEREADSLSIREKGGESMRLKIGTRTRITLDGRVVNVWSVPEGAEVRASWDASSSRPVADQIEVLDLRPAP